ncbi:MAG: hypothetical protein NWF01_06035 [Candidatus Bathyarchaeota archaeon]|nr:hypothetical protein [Candidatus Bathyarchaeota archaeon]
MAIEQFMVQSPFSVFVIVIVAGIIAAGSVLAVLGFLGKLSKFVSIGYRLNSKLVAIISGILLVALAVSIAFVYFSPSTITVGSGYVNVQFANFSPDLPNVPFVSGNKNITSTEVASVFVGQVGSGNFTLDKQYGTNFDNVNVGVFTLGNGAKAYVASNNSTNLIIQLNSGEYLILGTANTDALAASFSKNVYPLTPP